jgi:hypothetical protein
MGNAVVNRDDLLFVGVPAVIQDDVDISHSGKEGIPEPRIALVSNVDFETGAFPIPGGWIEIDAYDACVGAKIVAPHEERATIQNTHFDKSGWSVPVSREQLFVDLKVR